MRVGVIGVLEQVRGSAPCAQQRGVSVSDSISRAFAPSRASVSWRFVVTVNDGNNSVVVTQKRSLRAVLVVGVAPHPAQNATWQELQHLEVLHDFYTTNLRCLNFVALASTHYIAMECKPYRHWSIANGGNVNVDESIMSTLNGAVL